MIRRAAIAATLLFLLSAASVSAAASLTVQTVNTSFSPSTATITLGAPVNWQNQSAILNHTSTSDLAGLWNLTLNHETITVFILFNNAGSFAYHCNIHSTMHGTIKVKMAAAPTSATLGTAFTIVWAMNTAPTGYVFDVQRKKPGGSFKNWKTGVTIPSATNTPTRKGTFQFRARLHKVGGSSTGYSPVLSISVH